MTLPDSRRPALALALFGLCGCGEQVCQLDMTVSGVADYDAIAWSDATCSVTPEYESLPAITIEHERTTLEIYTFSSDFEVGSQPANATFIAADGASWTIGDCTLVLTRAELEAWTKADRWFLEGSLDCVYNPSEGIGLSNVAFSIYANTE